MTLIVFSALLHWSLKKVREFCEINHRIIEVGKGQVQALT